jgi:hypothetical protein
MAGYNLYSEQLAAISNLAANDPHAAAVLAREYGLAVPLPTAQSQTQLGGMAGSPQIGGGAYMGANVGSTLQMPGATTSTTKNKNPLDAAIAINKEGRDQGRYNYEMGVKNPMDFEKGRLDLRDTNMSYHMDVAKALYPDDAEKQAAYVGDVIRTLQPDAVTANASLAELGKKAVDDSYGWTINFDRTPGEKLPNPAMYGRLVARQAAYMGYTPDQYNLFSEQVGSARTMPFDADGTRDNPTNGLFAGIGAQSAKQSGTDYSQALRNRTVDMVGKLFQRGDGKMDEAGATKYADTLRIGMSSRFINDISKALGVTPEEYKQYLDNADDPQQAWFNHFREAAANLDYYNMSQQNR